MVRRRQLTSKPHVTMSHGADDRSTQPVVLRLPEHLLAALDEAVKTRSVKIPRHTWLLEAVVEKLDRERKIIGGGHGSK